MKQELIKPIIKLGNSAGVILPKMWLNGKARIELLEKPLDIKRDIFEILWPYFDDIQGVYLVGSYARVEQTKNSDIDVLVITRTINKRVDKGKYNLILITKESVEDSLKNNILPILPMLKEVKSLLNSQLIEHYKSTKLTPKNLKFHIETTKSAMQINETAIKLDKNSSLYTSDASAYSLILRLREAYIVDCLIKGKKWSNKELILLIKKIVGSLKAYNGYLRVKNNKRTKEDLTILEAEKLQSYIIKKIKEQEKWLQKRKLKNL